MREQFDKVLNKKRKRPSPYVTGKLDARKSYYLSGAVWFSISKAFAKNKRITTAIKGIFISREVAGKHKLPIVDIDNKT